MNNAHKSRESLQINIPFLTLVRLQNETDAVLKRTLDLQKSREIFLRVVYLLCTVDILIISYNATMERLRPAQVYNLVRVRETSWLRLRLK